LHNCLPGLSHTAITTSRPRLPAQSTDVWCRCFCACKGTSSCLTIAMASTTSLPTTTDCWPLCRRRASAQFPLSTNMANGRTAVSPPLASPASPWRTWLNHPSGQLFMPEPTPDPADDTSCSSFFLCLSARRVRCAVAIIDRSPPHASEGFGIANTINTQVGGRSWCNEKISDRYRAPRGS